AAGERRREQGEPERGQRRQDERGEGEEAGGSDGVEDEVGRRVLAEVGRAEVSAQDAADPREVLHDDRVVETHLLTQGGQLLGVDAWSRRTDRRGVTRDEAQDDEDDGGREDEGQNARRDPPEPEAPADRT